MDNLTYEDYLVEQHKNTQQQITELTSVFFKIAEDITQLENKENNTKLIFRDFNKFTISEKLLTTNKIQIIDIIMLHKKQLIKHNVFINIKHKEKCKIISVLKMLNKILYVMGKKMTFLKPRISYELKKEKEKIYFMKNI